MPIICDFACEGQTLIYYSGEQINGNVCLTTTKCFMLKDLSITFLGSGSTNWREFDKNAIIEHNDSTKANNKIAFTGSEEYVRETKHLMHNASIEPGTTLIPFFFVIPDNVPASCKQDYGTIQYQLHITLKRKSKCSKTVARNISIKRKLHLRHDVFDRTAACSIATTDYIFSIPQAGYMPGQAIAFSLNKIGSVDAAKCFPYAKINLNQCISYYSQLPTTRIKNVIKALATFDCNAINCIPMQCGYLRIPLTASITSDLKRQHLLRISYHLEILFCTIKNKIITKFKLPITIATNLQHTTIQPGIAIDASEEKLLCYDNIAARIDSVENLHHACHKYDWLAMPTGKDDANIYNTIKADRSMLLQSA